MSISASPLKCPNCEGQNLDAVSAPSGNWFNCPSCGGIFIHHDLLLSLSQDPAECAQVLEETRFLLLPTDRSCPQCSQKLSDGSARSRGLIFSLCTGCQSYWTHLDTLEGLDQAIESSVRLSMENPWVPSLPVLPTPSVIHVDSGFGSLVRSFAKLFDQLADRLSKKQKAPPQPQRKIIPQQPAPWDLPALPSTKPASSAPLRAMPPTAPPPKTPAVPPEWPPGMNYPLPPLEPSDFDFDLQSLSLEGFETPGPVSPEPPSMKPVSPPSPPAAAPTPEPQRPEPKETAKEEPPVAEPPKAEPIRETPPSPPPMTETETETEEKPIIAPYIEDELFIAPEPILESLPEPQHSLEPELRLGPQPETKPEPEAEPKAIPKMEPVLETQALPVPEQMPQPKPVPLPEPEPEPEAEPKAIPKMEPVLETQALPVPEQMPQPKPAPLPEPEPEPKAEPKAIPKMEPVLETQALPVPEQMPQPKPVPLPEPEPEPKAEPKAIPKMEPVLEIKALPVPEQMPQPKPVPKVVTPISYVAKKKISLWESFKQAWNPQPSKTSTSAKTVAPAPAKKEEKKKEPLAAPKPAPIPAPTSAPPVKPAPAPKPAPVPKPASVPKPAPARRPKKEKVPGEPFDHVGFWLPWGLGILSVVLSSFREFGFEGEPAILWGIMGWALGMLARSLRMYPFKKHEEATLANLLETKGPRGWKGIPVALKGTVLPAEEAQHKSLLIFKQGEMTIALNRIARWDILPRLFGLSNPGQILKGEIRLTGWFRGGVVPWVEIRTIASEKTSRASIVKGLRRALPIILWIIAFLINLSLE